MKTGWLAATMATVGAAAATGAATEHAHVGKAHPRRPAHVAAQASTATPAVPVAIAPVAPAPAHTRWLDDADAMMAAIGDAAPDLAFTDGGAARYGWRLADGATVVAEPMGADDTRFYFFAADMTAPFLVRDGLYAYGFDRGRLAAVFDDRGEPAVWAAGDWREDAAADLYARGRRLWFAARLPAPVAARLPNPPVLVQVVADLSRWRDDDGWRERRGRGARDTRTSPRFTRPPVNDDAGNGERRRGEQATPPPPAEPTRVTFAPVAPPARNVERPGQDRPGRAGERPSEGGARDPAARPSPVPDTPSPAVTPAAPEPAPLRAEPSTHDDGARPERAREARRPDPEAVERPD